MSAKHDEANLHWPAEAERYLNRRGITAPKQVIVMNLVRLTPGDTPPAIGCQAKCNGKTCMSIPQLLVYHRNPFAPWKWCGEVVCQDCYAKTVAHYVGEGKVVREIRHDVMPAITVELDYR